MNKFTYLKLICVLLIAFFIFINPTVSAFKKDVPTYSQPQKDRDSPEYVDPHYEVKRDRNYYLSSHFRYFNLSYLGIAGNFFLIEIRPERHVITSESGQVMSDEMILEKSVK